MHISVSDTGKTVYNLVKSESAIVKIVDGINVTLKSKQTGLEYQCFNDGKIEQGGGQVIFWRVPTIENIKNTTSIGELCTIFVYGKRSPSDTCLWKFSFKQEALEGEFAGFEYCGTLNKLIDGYVNHDF